MNMTWLSCQEEEVTLVAKQQLGEMATKQICQVKTTGCYNVSGNKTGYKLTFSRHVCANKLNLNIFINKATNKNNLNPKQVAG